ncbi:hypothetical protein HDU82_005173 [Entophlyctis luteolus]|nr:hypothetical protein HDU82_005173 [Entophlyctis luteolus]
MNSRPLSSTRNASLTSASTASSASKHSKHAGNRSGSSASASKRRPKLYQSVGSEEKARLAVVQAFENSPETFLCTYSVKRIIGFGSNGVVLAALMGNLPVAIKVIYKGRKASQSTAPSEIQVLKHLTVDRGESHLLKYVDDWQDSHHFYLVTELFGSDWLAVAPTARRENLQPLDFSICFQHKSHPVNLEFSAGASDLWAWAYAHRAHVWETSSYSHTLLPLRPVRQLVSQIALALSEMHAEGYYHGDIKVENILVQNNRHAGTAGPRVKLADFGHAKHVSCGIAAYGTPEMSAPEFLRGSPYHTGAKVRVNHNADCSDARAADVFALGMLTFMLLTEAGTLPERAAACASARITYADLVSEDSGFFPFSRCELADIDDDGVALINGMCMVDPARRLDIHQVLAHPWFADS